MAELILNRTKKGFPCIGVGGGRMTSTFTLRTVLVQSKPLSEPNPYSTKPAIFVRTKGHRSNEHDQAIVIVESGDIIVVGTGSIPINPENTEITLNAEQVKQLILSSTGDTYRAITEPVTVNIDQLPESIIKGASLYHNRDGEYFTSGVINNGK
jgi:hypothetical protein